MLIIISSYILANAKILGTKQKKRISAMPSKPGVAGSIPGFSVKTTFGEPLGVPL